MEKRKYQYGIVIIGYKNTAGMKRVLQSLSEVDFYGATDITLIISIDYSGTSDVADIANAFDWKYGPKIVNAYKENLGLKAHILSCGDYMEKYDLDAIAVLEDDIYVSPCMYDYMRNAIPFYINDERIAGISLYKQETNLLAKRPFSDLQDGGDTFFIQYAQSWGQIWLRERWKEFRAWYDAEKWSEMDLTKVPANVKAWNKSWLKFHIMYCIDTNKYFVYPRISLTTNFSDAGTHRDVSSPRMQVSLRMKKTDSWKFNTLETTDAVYDAFFESQRIEKWLSEENILVDIPGVKDKGESKYILSCMPLNCHVQKSWGMQLRPIELNIKADIPGNAIFLYDAGTIDENKVSGRAKRIAKNRIFEYDLKGVNILQCSSISHIVWRVKQYINFRTKRKKSARKRGK